MNKLVSLLVLAVSISAFSTPVNITAVGPIVPDGWKVPFTNVPPGDNETMPRTLQGNKWDMEAVLLDGNNLSLVASYDWKNGVPTSGVTTGDLFLAVNGDTKYDYALRFNFTTSQYEVYQLAANYDFTHCTDISTSNPFTVIVNSKVTDLGSFNFDYTTGLSDNAALGYTTWYGSGDGIKAPITHNKITLDLASFLTVHTGEEIATHITMSCGNDELNGHGRIPEPGSLSLILVGLVSLAGLAASRKRK